MSVLPAWYYNEFQQVGVDFEDRLQVEAYDYNQRSSSEQAELKLIEWLGISAGHTVIDLGAGTGTFAIQACKAGACVHVVDVSPTMLAYAQKKAGAAKAENLRSIPSGAATQKTKFSRLSVN